MKAILIRERYKVAQVLHVAENYAFAEAVDILDREMTPYLLNIYEGPQMWHYIGCMDQLSGCPEFYGKFLSDDSLITVFRMNRGQCIDEVFYRGATFSWEERLVFAQELLHCALAQANFPPEVSCAALLSENVLVERDECKIALRYMIRPLEGMNRRELVYLAGDQVKKILMSRFSSVDEELNFLKLLDQGACLTIVQLYSAWLEAKPKIQGAYEALYKKNAFNRWCTLLWWNVKRKLFGRNRR